MSSSATGTGIIPKDTATTDKLRVPGSTILGAPAFSGIPFLVEIAGLSSYTRNSIGKISASHLRI